MIIFWNWHQFLFPPVVIIYILKFTSVSGSPVGIIWLYLEFGISFWFPCRYYMVIFGIWNQFQLMPYTCRLCQRYRYMFNLHWVMSLQICSVHGLTWLFINILFLKSILSNAFSVSQSALCVWQSYIVKRILHCQTQMRVTMCEMRVTMLHCHTHFTLSHAFACHNLQEQNIMLQICKKTLFRLLFFTRGLDCTFF